MPKIPQFSDKNRLILYLLLGCILLLPNLGQRPYWGDEREDFNYIEPILRTGLPDVTGTVNEFSKQTNSYNLHVYHSWAPLYENALMVKLFGWDNEFAFRLPGFLGALLSIFGVWLLARAWGQRGDWATLIYVLSPFFLVPARCSRYYGMILGITPFVFLYIPTFKRTLPAPDSRLDSVTSAGKYDRWHQRQAEHVRGLQ
jgi:4-amino-4-deoxy-L-arabinose transferase-like glycosyltransferase